MWYIYVPRGGRELASLQNREGGMGSANVKWVGGPEIFSCPPTSPPFFNGIALTRRSLIFLQYVCVKSYCKARAMSVIS